MKLSIIIPVYNERFTIEKVLSYLEKVSVPPSIEKEYIVVDDGSTDGTKERIKTFLKKRNKHTWKYVFHSKNQGKGKAIQSGIKKADGSYMLIQDADLEYDPKYIVALLKPLSDKQSLVVYGTRLKRLPNFLKEEKHPLFIAHYFGNRFLSLLVSILYWTWLTDIETGYKLIPMKFMKEMKIESTGFEIEAELTVKLLRKGYSIFEVPIVTIPRGYNDGKKLKAIPEGIKAVKLIVKYRFM